MTTGDIEFFLYIIIRTLVKVTYIEIERFPITKSHVLRTVSNSNELVQNRGQMENISHTFVHRDYAHWNQLGWVFRFFGPKKLTNFRTRLWTCVVTCILMVPYELPFTFIVHLTKIAPKKLLNNFSRTSIFGSDIPLSIALILLLNTY